MRKKVKILKIEQVTHNVKSFFVEKPEGYKFIPGQATYVSIDLSGWRHEERPFTFTGLEDQEFLQFIIKRYPEHHGVTDKIHTLDVGGRFIIGKPFGAISYNGKGVFIAGGAGITPFIAIFRKLFKEEKISGNTLIFSNKTAKDIILEQELKKMFASKPEDLMLVVTDEKNPSYKSGFVDEDFIKKNIKDFNQKFYICGPPQMTKQLIKSLKKLGADINEVIFEK